MYVPQFFVSSQQRFGSPQHVTALRSWKNCVIALRQISVTALLYLEDSRRIHPWSMGACQPKDSKRREWKSMWGRERERQRAHTRGRERERESALAPPFIYIFSSTWACPMQIGLSQKCCVFYLKSSFWSSDLPLSFLCSIFADFSLPCLLATAILDSFSLLYLLTELTEKRSGCTI